MIEDNENSEYESSPSESESGTIESGRTDNSVNAACIQIPLHSSASEVQLWPTNSEEPSRRYIRSPILMRDRSQKRKRDYRPPTPSRAGPSSITRNTSEPQPSTSGGTLLSNLLKNKGPQKKTKKNT